VKLHFGLLIVTALFNFLALVMQ